MFDSLSRQQFRRYFQPSRVVLGIIPAPTRSGVNITTLCFSTHCSYKPPMLAIAIHDRSASYNLIRESSDYVLAVPGQTLADAAMFCGTNSMSEVDKVVALGLALVPSHKISVPGLADAIANIEMRRKHLLETGDHVLVVGEVLRFGVNRDCQELPLLSFGPEEEGYRQLRKKGIHRLGVVRR